VLQLVQNEKMTLDWRRILHICGKLTAI